MLQYVFDITTTFPTKLYQLRQLKTSEKVEQRIRKKMIKEIARHSENKNICTSILDDATAGNNYFVKNHKKCWINCQIKQCKNNSAYSI